MSDTAITTQTSTPDRLLELAITSGADVDKLERLMALQERWQASQARESYFVALSKFQAEAPPVELSKAVRHKDGTVRYRYAPLDAIIKALRPTLLKHGFSHTFQSAQGPDGETVITCTAHHVGGHSESASVSIPTFAGQYTNAAQDQGSALTYGQRHAFRAVFGITSGSQDDDGRGAGPEHIIQLQKMADAAREWFATMMCIKENLGPGGDKSAAAEAYAEFPWPVICALDIAPTKCGLWTTAERKTFSTDTEFQAMVHAARGGDGGEWYQRKENQK